MSHKLEYISGIFALVSLCCGNAAASAPSDTVAVRFRQSRSLLDLGFAGNGERLDSLLRRISKRETLDSSLTVQRVRVVGGASPEGTTAINSELSRHRAQAIFDWLSPRIEIQDSTVAFNYLGRDWSGLRRIVEADGQVPDREQVLDFLDYAEGADHGDADHRDGVLARFKVLSGGRPYRYLYDNAFPSLRASSVIIDYAVKPSGNLPLPDLSPSGIPLTPDIPPAAITGWIPSESSRRACRPFYMAVKTNLLSDALLLPNLGAEFYLGKNWSIAGDWTYGWWDNDARHHYWRAYGGELAVRRWFGRKASEKPLTGHHLGIYGGAVTYDFEFGGTGHMGGVPGGTLWDRCNWFAGVEYGYSLPVAKRLNIDFTLGVGYLGGKYIKYQPKNGFYQWQSTNRLNWFGPTKAEVSLVWLIGCDNWNRGKGGRP